MKKSKISGTDYQRDTEGAQTVQAVCAFLGVILLLATKWFFRS
jgi:hypothetical protein